jgi:DNA invertase Pin-like site-specific DNA recombinase
MSQGSATDEKVVQEIKRLYKLGCSLRVIAIRTGLHKMTVSKYLKEERQSK